MFVTVFGLGKAGLPLACVMASSEINVIGVDVNKSVVNSIMSKKPPFEGEPGIKDMLNSFVGKTLFATTDAKYAIRKSSAHIIIVPLFIDKNKRPDFKAIDSVSKIISQNMKKNDLVVLETTVPPGTTETRIRAILEKGSNMKAGEDFFLAHSPERIMTGYSISRFKEFPKIVGGINKKSTEKAYSLY